jgi:hypothetical protein
MKEVGPLRIARPRGRANRLLARMDYLLSLTKLNMGNSFARKANPRPVVAQFLNGQKRQTRPKHLKFPPAPKRNGPYTKEAPGPSRFDAEGLAAPGR